jgi:hypothetical protein
MTDLTHFDALRHDDRLRWVTSERAWLARPDDVVDALAQRGYAEYKRERAHEAGGVWLGIDTRGSVASAIWVQRPTDPDALVFIAIDGEPVTEP